MSSYWRRITIAVNFMVFTGMLPAGARPSAPLFLPLPLDEALTLAFKQNRIVFIDFCTAWCGACRRLDEDTWRNGKVIEQLKKKTIPLKLDADKEPAIRDKYKIRAYPTLLFLNPDGSVLARFVGYQIPSQFIKTLKGVMAAEGVLAGDKKLFKGGH
jgi:thiol-disulfide isomerase/thioredoxin